MLLWVSVVVFGVIQAWHWRYSMNPDGVSYLDIAQAYARGDWQGAVNAYWSPLYSWLLVPVVLIAYAAPYWESLLVHLLNFAAYLGAWAALEHLVGVTTEYQDRELRAMDDAVRPVFPRRTFHIVAYGLFVTATANWITIELVTPDLCVAILIFLCAALLLRLQMGTHSRRVPALLRLTLGLAYLAKAAMLVVAVVVLLLVAVSNARRRRPSTYTAICLATFAALVLPFIAAISYQKGRLTAGDAGKLNLAWRYGGAKPNAPETLPVASDTLHHPPNTPLGVPEYREFGSPIGGTLPIWYDPSYWKDGVTVRLSPQRQLAILHDAVLQYHQMLVPLTFILAITVTLVAMPLSLRACRDSLRRQWQVGVLACSGLGVYALVLVEPRYVASFLILLLLAFCSGARLPASPWSAKLETASALTVCLFLAGAQGPWMGRAVVHGVRDFALRRPCKEHSHVQWRVARELHHLGLRPGDRVAYIGKTDAYWARLARLRIVATVYDVAEPPSAATRPGVFVGADGTLTVGFRSALRRTGARAVVTPVAPVPGGMSGWVTLGDTGYRVCLLR